jgi:thymidylate kinase
MNKRTIAILGVDGSGKSTAVELVGNHYGKDCVVTYMGFRRYEDPRIEQLQKKTDRNILDSLRILLLIYKCFWYRYNKALKAKKLILFDRYTHEGFINASGRFKGLRVLLFKYLFPKPSKIVYLYCSVEESLRRKDDIDNKELFITVKKRFDDYFLNRKGVLSLDTGFFSREEIANSIIQYIEQ